MSSTSIARQNRRKRLRQDSSALPKVQSKLVTLSASELASAEEMTENSDKDSKMYYNEPSFDKTKAVESESYEALSYATNCSIVNGDVSSQPVGKIFIEGERGFREINASQIFQLSPAEFSAESDHKNELFHLAFEIAKYFHCFSNFCHGLLGGMSLLYIFVLLHLFSTLSVNEETIKYFSFFSKPIHNVFNFLCIICCVSTFDRVDITNTEELFKLIRKLDFKLITLLIYPISLLLSFSTANVDDKLSMFEKNATVWDTLNFEEEYELYYWKTLSISKCFGAVLGWIVICWDQSFNLFLGHMRSILHRIKILY